MLGARCHRGAVCRLNGELVDKISVVLQGTTNFYVPEDPLDILFVIRDGYGNVIPKYISEATGDGLDLLGIVCGAKTTVLESGDLLMENFTECASLFDYGFDNYSYLTLMSPLYPVDQVKINNSAGAEAVAVAPQDEIKVLLPNDYDPAQLVTDIQLNSDSVDAPVREGDVLGHRRSALRNFICRCRDGGLYPEKLVEVGRDCDLCRHRCHSGTDSSLSAAQAPLPPHAYGAAPPRAGGSSPALPRGLRSAV